MSHCPTAGTLPRKEDLVDLTALTASYYALRPDPHNQDQAIKFGTSGHRGTSFDRTFNEDHILAVTQAVCDVRKAAGISGPLFLGKDTHALSEPAFSTALEVLAANGVQTMVQPGQGFTPTPAVSQAILSWNRDRSSGQADGIIITPSHNPPEAGGFKYNPPNGGPADTALTGKIQARANELLAAGNAAVLRMSLSKAANSGLIVEYDYIADYIENLKDVIDFNVITGSGLKLGVNPLGGASLPYWEPLADMYGLNLTITNPEFDPAFSFVPLDHDGKIRMDCSSPWAMHSLLDMKNDFDLAFACDPDSDRHGIVTPQGLLNPNHYLSAAAHFLFGNRPGWPVKAALGKTTVTTALLDRIAADFGRPLLEMPVGFKWFVSGLFDGTCAIGCEESAGASFLRHNGGPWSTDKDGILLCLLAVEMTARSGKNPAEYYAGLTAKYGQPIYKRLDFPLSGPERTAMLKIDPAQIKISSLAGSPVLHVQNRAPGNGESLGGIKVISNDGWFAIRPSGTEPICKLYMESLADEKHFERLQTEALAFAEAIK